MGYFEYFHENIVEGFVDLVDKRADRNRVGTWVPISV